MRTMRTWSLASFKTSLRALLAPTRIWDWWEFKTPVFLAVAYVVGSAAGVPFSVLWPRLLLVIGALIPVASYVCVINEITDLEVDRRAGKANAMEGRSRRYQMLWVLACLAGGALALLALRSSGLAAWAYGANWLAFTLYSVPPVRLKIRGLWGVVADACGGQLLPTLWTAATVSRGFGMPVGWLVLLGAWAFVLGLRGILGHQLRDLRADRTSGVATLVARIGIQRTQQILSRLLLPLELLLFGLVVALAGAWLALLALAGVVGIRWAVQRKDLGKSVLAFYLSFFPLAGVLQLGLQNASALVLLPLQVLVFPACWGLSLARLAGMAKSNAPEPEPAIAVLPPASVSVVIPAYQGSRTIRACLHGLQQQRGLEEAEVIVVESSGDGTAEIIKREFLSVTVLREPTRLSAGAARNSGASLARGEFLLFIDQDCVAPPDWAQRLVSHLQRPGVDAVGGSIGIADPDNLSGAATYFLEFLHHFPHLPPPRHGHPFLLGCNLGVRREVMAAVSFPDRTLAEDVLFCERLRRAGFGVMYDPGVTVLHFNRQGWGYCLAYARKMGRAAAVYHATLRRNWMGPVLRWPVLATPLSLLVTPLIGLRLLCSGSERIGLFLRVAPACLWGNLCWAAGFRERMGELQEGGQ